MRRLRASRQALGFYYENNCGFIYAVSALASTVIRSPKDSSL